MHRVRLDAWVQLSARLIGVNLMRPTELKELIKSIHNANLKRAILIEGSAGLGKTQIVAQVAKELGIGFKVVHAPMLLPEDYGIPVIQGPKKDRLDFVVSTLKFPLESSDCLDKGIFLIDELPQTDNSGQKILANLIQEREIHGHKLKSGWTIVATGNRQNDRAGANRLLSHLANRLTRVSLDVSLDDWTQWSLSNQVKTELVAFIRFRPELLNNFDAKNDINATPRSWIEGVAQKLGVIPQASEFETFSGDVGEGPASEFLAFLKIFRKLPNPDAILLKPKTAEVPQDVATIYALVGALVARVTESNFGKALEYIKRLPPEFSVLFVRDAIARCEGIQTTPEFIQWASKDGANLLS